MSSLPPSSTPPEGDDSAPVSLPAAVDAAPESSPEVAAAVEPSPPVAADASAEPQPAGQTARPALEDCGPQLKKLYPALFSNPPKPIKLRIQADIQERSPGLFTKPQLSAFLRRYTGSHAYLNALVKATHRFDLDGNPGDELSDEHRNAATEELARRRANTQARTALEQEQRANRATLLKEFEANTLPVAEFAAAKGVPEGELEPLIARARKEAFEPPPAPAFNRDRRGPQHNRGPRPEGQGPRGPRPPRDANAQPAVAANGAAPQADAPRAPRPPRADGPRSPRTDAPRGPRGDRPQGPRPDAPRADGPRGPLDAPRAERPRGPLDAPRGPRPEGQRNGPRPDSRGPRADGPRGANNGPRSDAPRGPRRDDDRRPPRPDDRGPRPNVVSSPAAPTAMALAFSALNALKTKK
ncbi:ProQ/FINO family protein [Scleromatobacter humisilvae]|uniref:ProQ/FINO family protein n=1 Tax=Scleromatobacter humisilvae TaxID=2897159 RepID=A0A9X2BYB0_9BURK|nr:ProQ/FINO family protein [Scleromatobacter humisilvae]MCK9685217.1 ProQ/FINO family protein [Scleromatobacter humisilvae]